MVFDFIVGTCQLAKYKRCFCYCCCCFTYFALTLSDNIYLRSLFFLSLCLLSKKKYTYSQTLSFSHSESLSQCVCVCVFVSLSIFGECLADPNGIKKSSVCMNNSAKRRKILLNIHTNTHITRSRERTIVIYFVVFLDGAFLCLFRVYCFIFRVFLYCIFLPLTN